MKLYKSLPTCDVKLTRLDKPHRHIYAAAPVACNFACYQLFWHASIKDFRKNQTIIKIEEESDNLDTDRDKPNYKMF